MRTCHCFFCAKATSLPRFENPRTAKNRPTFATGKSGLGSKCVWSPLLDDDAVGIQSKVCTKTSRRSLLLPLAKKCLWKSQHSSEQSLALFFWMFKPAKVYLFLVCSSKMLKPLFFENQTNLYCAVLKCHAVMQVMCSSVLCLILATVLEKLGLPESAGEARQPL